MKTPIYRLLIAAALPIVLAACSMFNSNTHHPDPPPSDEPKETTQDDQKMYLQLIQQMQQQGAYYASLAHIEACRQRYGDSASLRLLQAEALRETGQTDAAEKLYAGLLKGAQAGPAWHGQSLIEASRGEFDRAEQGLAKAVQLDPLNTAYLGDLGFARLRAGQIASAHDPLARAAELDPNNPKAIANLALWTLLSGSPDKADAMMQQAKLPEATRGEVHRLAANLLATAMASPTATPMPVAPAFTARPESIAPMTASPRTNMPAAVAGIPANMLDRFGPSPHAAPSEATP